MCGIDDIKGWGWGLRGPYVGDDGVPGLFLTLLYLGACAAWYNGMLLILEFIEWMDQYRL